jgi:ferredoxin
VLDTAGARELALSPQLLPVEVPCLRHVSDALMLSAFRMGAAGVAVAGCETCPHGERELLHRNLDIAQRVAEAAGLGAGRIKLIPVRDGCAQPEPALTELNAFAASLRPSPVTFEADRAHAAAHHELVGDAVRTFVAQTGPKIEPVALPEGSPYARADVHAAGCTLCRSCANVCPSHAFRFDDRMQALEFKQMACVACGLCETVCPERVITLRPELSLTAAALDYQVLAQDEQVYCAKCKKPYINKRALDAIEAKVKNAPQLAGVFEGSRAGMLRMCPDCRAIAAMLNVRDGWKP